MRLRTGVTPDRCRRAVLAAAVLGVATDVAGGEEAPAQPSSYEAVASAEGFRFSFGAPGFVAVDTFIDGGGPVSQSVIDGLGNSRAFASLPYPGDLAITGPGLAGRADRAPVAAAVSVLRVVEPSDDAGGEGGAAGLQPGRPPAPSRRRRRRR